MVFVSPAPYLREGVLCGDEGIVAVDTMRVMLENQFFLDDDNTSTNRFPLME